MITYIPVLPVWMIDNDEMALSLTVSGDHTLPTSGHVWLYGPQVQKLPIYLEMCVCACVCVQIKLVQIVQIALQPLNE